MITVQLVKTNRIINYIDGEFYFIDLCNYRIDFSDTSSKHYLTLGIL